MTAPIICEYDGEAFIPVRQRQADKDFVVGIRYPLVIHEDRSTKTHNHEFAWLRDAWMNLPEDLADIYPTAEHLRKRALIQAGFYDEQIVDAGSQAAALRVAAAFRSREEFSLVIVRGSLVILRTAKSQSRRAMTRKEFQESKTAIMDVIAAMIDVKPAQLEREAGRAA